MFWDAILFDMDGTLIDVDMKKFLHDYFGLWQHLVAKYTDEPAEFVKRLIWATDKMVENTDKNLTNEEAYWQAFSDHNWPYEIYKPIADKFYENEFLLLEPLVNKRPAMISLIQKLQGQTKLALATNSVFPKKAILSRLKWGGLQAEYFDFIANYEQMHFCKPRPGYFLEITEFLNVDLKRSLVVGDDPQLDLVAHKLGMATFFLDVAEGQDAEWDGEAIHVVTEEDRKKGREVADHYGDIAALEKFIFAGLNQVAEKDS